MICHEKLCLVAVSCQQASSKRHMHLRTGGRRYLGSGDVLGLECESSIILTLAVAAAARPEVLQGNPAVDAIACGPDALSATRRGGNEPCSGGGGWQREAQQWRKYRNVQSLTVQGGGGTGTAARGGEPRGILFQQSRLRLPARRGADKR